MILNYKSFLQSDVWGSFRESLGWHAHKIGDTLVLERPLPLKRSLLYSPELSASPELLLTLLPQIYEIGKRRNSIVFRTDFLIDKNDVLAERWAAALHYTGFVPAFESIQPEDRQIVPLSTESAVLAQMKQKGRYNIKIAEKSGVLVRESTKKSLAHDVKLFHKLLLETAKREKFVTRPESYFQELCNMLYAHNCGGLFIATKDDIPLAASVITLYDGVASYLYGGSSREHREAMPTYAMHWAVMQWAMSKDAKYYDLLAISPEKKNKHIYDGITKFKQQFGGESVHLIGCYDLPLNQSWYTAFKASQKMRRR